MEVHALHRYIVFRYVLFRYIVGAALRSTYDTKY